MNDFTTNYPTPADRARLVASTASNLGMQALFGPVHHIDTVGGYVAWHGIGILGLIGAFWGLLTATRLLRGEEDAGRWELLLAGQTTRARAALGALGGLGIALAVLWAVTAATAFAVGRTADPAFSAGASMFLALATVTPAALFLAVGALCGQLAGSRRQAAWLAAAVFGVAYAIRIVAYTGSTLRWIRWASPLAWVDDLRPLTDPRPLMLLPILAVIAALVAATTVLAGRRDLGAGTLPARDTAPARTRLLGGPLGLAVRLTRPGALGWITGLALGGFMFGIITKTAADAMAGSSRGVLQRLGGASGGAAYLGFTFLFVTLLVAMAAAAQVGATRDEETQGHLDLLLARPVSRMPWLAGRFAVSAAVLVAAGAAAGLFTWVGAAASGAGVALPTLLAAGLNVVPAGILVLGIGTLVHGLAPRLASSVAYGVVAFSFIVELLGTGLPASRWLLDLSVLHHISRAPAADPRWDMAAILVAVGIAAAALGAAAFTRRDLKGA
ncbi:ABC transporter permease subunit [Streptomyces canus]|uniref:ABC transporter permease subunit n=1 Tax=Streptomyces canus TaxID=58343 RepID=UPI0036EA50A4